MFFVTVINRGTKFWMRGTTWAFNYQRGDTYATREEALAAIKRAKPFTHRTLCPLIEIEPMTLHQEFMRWTKSQNINLEGDAQELIMSGICSPSQVEWLVAFCDRWDAATQAHQWGVTG